MRVLLDTNILIYREDNHILPSDLLELHKILNDLNAIIITHPLSLEDIRKDKNETRRDVTLSKIQTYNMLDSYPSPKTDLEYLNNFKIEEGSNDSIDATILYSVYRNAVDFFITEDRRLLRKAKKLGLGDRVLLIIDALQSFGILVQKDEIIFPPALKRDYVYNLNLRDPIFNSLKEEYPGFSRWFEDISRKHRKCWVHYRKNQEIGAVLIYKIETESIPSIPPFPNRKRFKICTFKVTYVGNKIGELFLKLSVDCCIHNNIDEIYLTHFTREEDILVDLITEYGFEKAAEFQNGANKEDIFIKRLTFNKESLKSIPPIEISRRYYPNFYDGVSVNKFVVPIKPEYHNRLFTDFSERKPTKEETLGEFIVEGNAITKAYISHSPTKKIKVGDLLLFYCLSPCQIITSIGVVEAVYSNMQDSEQIFNLVAKRTVYPKNEIEEMEKPVLIILFRHHFHLKNYLSLKELKDKCILGGAPQSISKISHENYMRIKELGSIDGRYTIY